MDHSSYYKDQLRSRIEVFILQSLSSRDKYGYEILNEINEKGKGSFYVKQPTLYNSLKRLEALEQISSYAGEESKGGQRKYYSLTEKGNAVLQQNILEWEYSRTLVDSLLSERKFDLENDALPFTPGDLKPLTKRQRGTKALNFKDEEFNTYSAESANDEDEDNSDYNDTVDSFDDSTNSTEKDNITEDDQQETVASAEYGIKRDSTSIDNDTTTEKDDQDETVASVEYGIDNDTAISTKNDNANETEKQLATEVTTENDNDDKSQERSTVADNVNTKTTVTGYNSLDSENYLSDFDAIYAQKTASDDTEFDYFTTSFLETTYRESVYDSTNEATADEVTEDKPDEEAISENQTEAFVTEDVEDDYDDNNPHILKNPNIAVYEAVLKEQNRLCAEKEAQSTTEYEKTAYQSVTKLTASAATSDEYNTLTDTLLGTAQGEADTTSTATTEKEVETNSVDEAEAITATLSETATGEADTTSTATTEKEVESNSVDEAEAITATLSETAQGEADTTSTATTEKEIETNPVDQAEIERLFSVDNDISKRVADMMRADTAPTQVTDTHYELAGDNDIKAFSFIPDSLFKLNQSEEDNTADLDGEAIADNAIAETDSNGIEVNVELATEEALTDVEQGAEADVDAKAEANLSVATQTVTNEGFTTTDTEEEYFPDVESVKEDVAFSEIIDIFGKERSLFDELAENISKKDLSIETQDDFIDSVDLESATTEVTDSSVFTKSAEVATKEEEALYTDTDIEQEFAEDTIADSEDNQHSTPLFVETADTQTDTAPLSIATIEEQDEKKPALPSDTIPQQADELPASDDSSTEPLLGIEVIQPTPYEIVRQNEKYKDAFALTLQEILSPINSQLQRLTEENEELKRKISAVDTSEKPTLPFEDQIIPVDSDLFDENKPHYKEVKPPIQLPDNSPVIDLSVPVDKADIPEEEALIKQFSDDTAAEKVEIITEEEQTADEQSETATAPLPATETENVVSDTIVLSDAPDVEKQPSSTDKPRSFRDLIGNVRYGDITPEQFYSIENQAKPERAAGYDSDILRVDDEELLSPESIRSIGKKADEQIGAYRYSDYKPLKPAPEPTAEQLTAGKDTTSDTITKEDFEQLDKTAPRARRDINSMFDGLDTIRELDEQEELRRRETDRKFGFGSYVDGTVVPPAIEVKHTATQAEEIPAEAYTESITVPSSFEEGFATASSFEPRRIDEYDKYYERSTANAKEDNEVAQIIFNDAPYHLENGKLVAGEAQERNNSFAGDAPIDLYAQSVKSYRHTMDSIFARSKSYVSETDVTAVISEEATLAQTIKNATTVNNSASFEALKNQFDAAGYELRAYSNSVATSNVYAMSHVFSNKIRAVAMGMTLIVMLLEIFGCFVFLNNALQLSLKQYGLLAAIAAILPVISIIVYATNPSRRKKATFDIKKSLLSAIGIILELSAIILLAGWCFFDVSLNVVSTMYVPVFIPIGFLLNSIVYLLIYNLLYCSNKFYVG